MCKPRLCHYSLDFLRRHSDITSADAQAELALLCVIGKIITIGLENANAVDIDV